ncbi:hypothetical protein NLG97_g10749 [Lecanicillium saksenae]|uniref:Uncharacterized protein n=1 Tax=Lecanicillium saksenae TaxID=468837 RepID=A0ACC1QCH8_9HYPO|nr:hypothetical protein NLG97_g10749 [Lecanicillium saksenae]
MMTKSGLLSSRPCQRLLLVSVLIMFPIAVLLLLAGSGNNVIPLPGLYEDDKKVFTPKIGRCSHGERAAWASEWNVTERNHRDLLDDRFT